MSPWPHPDDRETAGAWLSPNGVCRWTVWSPFAKQVALILAPGTPEEKAISLQRGLNHYWSIELEGIQNGDRYLLKIDNTEPRPDPASKWQPEGVHGPSAVWDTERLEQGLLEATRPAEKWAGIPRSELVIYELHIGTFTPLGTFAAAIERLDDLVELGITAVEIMPVSQFPGSRNWGYDGTYWYAVQNSYGGPDGLQQFVAECHSRGLAVILDVVYNHLGPEGNYLSCFGPYFSRKYNTPWGSAVNFDDAHCDGVRDLVLNNVRYWIRKFQIDGLRLDAIHAMYDNNVRHILGAIRDVAHEEELSVQREIHIISESALNDPRVLDSVEHYGFSHDAQWCDDFHHSVHRLLTGEAEGHYEDYNDPPVNLAKVLQENYVLDGGYSPYRKRRHGRSAVNFPGDQFIISTQTHDQVGNRARGERLLELTGWPQARLAASLMLLAPNLPMLFMGEEYGEQRRFPFFCDFGDPQLQEAVRNGRRREFAEFGWDPQEIPDPCDPLTFESAILSWSWPEGSPNAAIRRLYSDLIAFRRSWSALKNYRYRSTRLFMAPPQSPLLIMDRWSPDHQDQRIRVIANLGGTLANLPTETLNHGTVLWRSEADCYTGLQTSEPRENRLQPWEVIVVSDMSPTSNAAIP